MLHHSGRSLGHSVHHGAGRLLTGWREKGAIITIKGTCKVLYCNRLLWDAVARKVALEGLKLPTRSPHAAMVPTNTSIMKFVSDSAAISFRPPTSSDIANRHYVFKTVCFYTFTSS